MARLRAIALAIDVATRQRDELAKRLAVLERETQSAQAQKDMLEGYAQETSQRWLGAASGAVGTEIMHNHFQFMGRLEQAIGMQRGVVGHAQRRTQDAHAQLVQAEFRLSGLKQLLQAHQKEALRVQQRREQRQTDEYASVLHMRSRVLAAQGD